jgi:hypothetical protein
MRAVAALSFAGAAPGVLGGLIFWAAHGHTALTRSVAYGLWFAAAVCLVLMVLAGNKRIWRATSLPVVDGWVFVTVAFLLCAAGAGIDVAGS